MTNTTKLFTAIVQNKKYRALSKQMIHEAITRYLKKFPKASAVLAQEKSEKFKRIVRDIRGELHAVHGTFQTTKKHKKDVYLQQIKHLLKQRTLDLETYLDVHKKILETNRSTKERLLLYPKLYHKIFEYTGKPQTILDLGCGLNPASLPFIHLDHVTYYAYDIDAEDIAFLNSYFALFPTVTGKAAVLDIRDIEKIKKLPHADVAFLFNALDPLEQGKGHKLSETLIQAIPATHIVVSFSTQTVSGKKMNYPYRGWIERMAERIGISFTLFQTPNELFYIVKKQV